MKIDIKDLEEQIEVLRAYKNEYKEAYYAMLDWCWELLHTEQQKELNTILNDIFKDNIEERILLECDNTDCKKGIYHLEKVKLKDEFNNDEVYWCRDCIDRDGDMIKDMEVKL